MVVRKVGLGDPVQMALAENDDLVQAFATKRAAEALRVRILPGRARGGQRLLDAHVPDPMAEVVAVDATAVADRVLGRGVLGEGFKVAVGAVKKSIEASEPRWSSRKVRQVCDGGLRCRSGMKRETLRSLISMPSLSSSPWILGAPEATLASAIRRTRCLTSAKTSSFVGERERDFHYQNRRKPARCQRTTMSGLTRTRASAERSVASRFRSKANMVG